MSWAPLARATRFTITVISHRVEPVGFPQMLSLLLSGAAKIATHSNQNVVETLPRLKTKIQYCFHVKRDLKQGQQERR
jgi:hypothetical protein